MFKWIMVIILVCGVWQSGTGANIYAKAWLAQQLLEYAWQKTLDGETNVRPWPWADTWPIAELKLPRLGVRRIILSGDSGRVLAFAPGYTEASALPGAAGITVISGHRDTTFRFLRDIKDGDLIELTTAARRFDYRVNERVVVDQRDIQFDRAIDSMESGANLVLVTCYPFDALMPGGDQRYLVLATGVF